MKIVVGTRGSFLAKTQTEQVVHSLQKHHPEIIFEIQIIKTAGDQNQETPLHKMNDKGIFVKEIEAALLDKKIDLAVHSMKDMPTVMDERLIFPVIPKREDPRDVLISRIDITPSSQNVVIGTGSKRREFQLNQLFPSAFIKPIRGNIDTRILKMHQGEYDAIVLAASGLARISRLKEASKIFSVEEMIPAPCQGILAIQTRTEDTKLIEKLACLNDSISKIQYLAERAFLKEINGGCHLPVGAYCHIQGEEIILQGIFGSEDGKKMIKKKIHGTINNAENLGVALGQSLREAMAIES